MRRPPRHAGWSAAVREVVHDTSWNAVAQVISKMKGLLLLVMLARLLGVEGYGVWVQIHVVAGLLGLLCGLGLFQSLVQFLPAATDRSKEREVVWNAILPVAACSLVVAAAMAALGPWLGATLGQGAGASWAFQLAGVLGGLLAAKLVLLNFLRARDRLRAFSLTSIAADAADVVFIGLLAFLFYSVGAAILGSVIAALVLVTWLLWQVIREVGGPRMPGPGMKPALRYALPLVPTQLADELMARADRLILGALVGPAATGIYSAAYSLVSVLRILDAAIVNVVFPKMVGRGWDASTTRRIWLTSTLGFTLLSLVVVVVLAVVGRPVLAFLLEMDATILPPSLPWMILAIGLGLVLFGAGRMISLSLYVQRRTLLVAVLWGTGAVANVGFNLALIPLIGVLGAAVATLFTYMLFVALLLLAVWRPSHGSETHPAHDPDVRSQRVEG